MGEEAGVKLLAAVRKAAAAVATLACKACSKRLDGIVRACWIDPGSFNIIFSIVSHARICPGG
jgi:hypothetical protein